jgi:3-mercaptopyruvate sulfurtransferase SseA
MDKKKPKPIIPLLLILAGVLLIIGVLIWQFAGANSVAAPTAEVINLSATPVESIERVDLQTAKQAYELKQAVFVDVRDAASFASGHVTGSINIPLNEIEGRLSELQKESWIITYCT